jgi:hypothetical protein
MNVKEQEITLDKYDAIYSIWMLSSLPRPMSTPPVGKPCR